MPVHGSKDAGLEQHARGEAALELADDPAATRTKTQRLARFRCRNGRLFAQLQVVRAIRVQEHLQEERPLALDVGADGSLGDAESLGEVRQRVRR